MSASFLMRQTPALAIALAALTAVGAHAATAKPHRHVSAQATHHAAPRKLDAASAHKISRTQARTTRKSKAHESGRNAGMAIRRSLAQKRAARRNVALHVEETHAAPRAQNEYALRFNQKSHMTSMEAAPDSPALRVPPMRVEEPTRTEKPATAEESAQPDIPAPDADTADLKARDAHTEAPDTGTEQASLRVPLSASPSALRGSRESLERQNTRLDAEGLERIEDETDLENRIAQKLLVPVPASSALTVNPELSATHRYCRPWTALFLTDLARAHDAAFHRPFEVSSAVRTMEYQKHLMEINGNAAPAEGDIVSPHLTGATIDIAKESMTRDELAWMRRHLLALEVAGKIDVEEEFKQACFHITVYKTYVPARAPHSAAPAGNSTAGSSHRKAPASLAVPVATQDL